MKKVPKKVPMIIRQSLVINGMETGLSKMKEMLTRERHSLVVLERELTEDQLSAVQRAFAEMEHLLLSVVLALRTVTKSTESSSVTGEKGAQGGL